MTLPNVQTPPQPTAEHPDPPVYRCFGCNGHGEVPMHYPNDKGVYVCNWQRCKHCGGSGQWTDEGRIA